MYEKKWIMSEKSVNTSFYSKTGRETRIDEAAMTSVEDGFMDGYEQGLSPSEETI